MNLAFARWTTDDVVTVLTRAGLRVDQIRPARWPAGAPQPTTHREAWTVFGPDVTDPHLVLLFDAPDALETWHLWLARYWKARPYLSVKDNVLLLVSRDLPPERAATLHAALSTLGQ